MDPLRRLVRVSPQTRWRSGFGAQDFQLLDMFNFSLLVFKGIYPWKPLFPAGSSFWRVKNELGFISVFRVNPRESACTFRGWTSWLKNTFGKRMAHNRHQGQ